MFRVCSHQLKISLCSPRIYIAVFAGIVIQIVSLISFLGFSKTIGKPLCVFESITYSNCDLYAPVALFLAVLVLVSDIPFTSQSETYTLLRISRKKWIAGKVLYLVSICAIYYLIVYAAGALFIAENAYGGNLWSEPLYIIANDTTSALSLSSNVYFPYAYILNNLTPYLAAFLIYLLSVSYATLMSLLVFWLNLKISRILSYAAVMLVHIVSYTLTALSATPSRINLSLFSNSLLMFHNIGAGSDERYNSILQTVIIYGVIIGLLVLMILHAIKRYDFRITVGGKQ